MVRPLPLAVCVHFILVVCIFIEFILVRHNENHTAQDFSEHATPTIEETASHAGLTEIHERTSRMKEAVR